MHLIGVTCMLLASKVEEIIPFKISTVVNKMTHGKITSKQVVEMEQVILTTLEFQLLRQPSLFIFVEYLVIKLNFHKSTIFKNMNKIILYILKMIMHEYDLITKF